MGQCHSSDNFKRKLIPAKAGVGLRTQHMAQFATGHADVSWVEIHAENYFCEGGPRLNALYAAREHYPVSVHGVGLSLGTAEGVSITHLQKLKKLCDELNPGLVSEHLSWSVSGGAYLNDLLPLPLNEESFNVFVKNIHQTQNFIEKQILIENPSIYLSTEGNEISEPDFLNKLVEETGCGILLDVNNIYVSGQNTGSSISDYIAALNLDYVQEIHVAGHAAEVIDGETILIDTHGDIVCDPVWEILDDVITKGGLKPVLMEWDTEIPSIDVLLGEASKAQKILDKHGVLSDVA